MSWRDVLAWSSWLFGLISVCAIVVGEHRLRKKSDQIRRVASQLEPTEAPLPASGGTGPALQPRTDDRIRSVLIQAAVDELPFRIALERARRFGADASTMEEGVRRLREAHLLKFDEPLTPDSTLKLT